MPYILDFAVLAVIYLICIKSTAMSKKTLAANTLMYIYLCGVLYFTLMPLIVALPHCFDHPYVAMNMTPFRDAIMGYGDFERQIILNILMTVPFGFLLPVCKVVSGKRCGFFHCVISVALLSLDIELLQPLISAHRSSDITDLITNTVGGAVGYLLYLPFKRFISKKIA